MSKDLSLNNLRYVFETYNAQQPMDAYYQPFIKAFFSGTPPRAILTQSGEQYLMFALKDIPTSAYSTTPTYFSFATHTLKDFINIYNGFKTDVQFPPTALSNPNSPIAKVVANCLTGTPPTSALQPQAVPYLNTVLQNIPSNITGLTTVPTPVVSPTDLYLGRFTTIKNDVVDFGGSKLQNIASAINSTDAINKTNLDSAISTINASIASVSSTDQAYTDTKVDEQKLRIDAILDGASLSLDSLKEVSDLCNALDATQAQDILTKTTTLSNSLDAEVARATLAEAELKKKDEFQTDVLPVVSVYADGEQPSQIPSAIKANPLFTGVDGWYYKNATGGKKANWYVPNVSSLKVSDIVNLTFDATLFSTSSPPFIQFYTQKTATGNAGSWYKARTTYSVADISKVSTYKDYQFCTLKANETPLPGKTQYALTLDTVGTVGTTSPDDLILAIAIGTNSSATQNSVEFVLDKVRIHTSNGVFAHNFSSFTTELNAVSSSLSSTNASLTTSVNTVATNLALEASRASTAETNLANSIADEQTRAENIETDLQNAIHNLTNDLEHLTREQADQLVNEIQRAQSAESDLSTRCDTLQQQQTVHTGQITQLYTYLFNTASSVVPIR